jgi:hypothetical protein
MRDEMGDVRYERRECSVECKENDLKAVKLLNPPLGGMGGGWRREE